MKRKTVVWILLGALASAGGAWGARAALTFNNTVTGEVLNLDDAVEEGRDTAAVKTFLDSGINSYNENPACLPKGEEIFLTACSGCHGHLGEGKLGPGLNDDYWTYPKNETDKGLFETIYGGAQGQMGPQYSVLTLDEMLLTMAWTRHLYKGDPKKAKWLTEEQRKVFKPYSADKKQQTDIAAKGECG